MPRVESGGEDVILDKLKLQLAAYTHEDIDQLRIYYRDPIALKSCG